MTIADVWDALEECAEGAKRRIEPDSPADIWLVRDSMGRRSMRVMGVGRVGFEDLTKSGGIEMTLREGSPSYLEVRLADPKFSDLFDVLVTDVASTAAKATSKSAVPGLVADRIKKWQLFLKKNRNGLSSETQCGLYGELWVLLKLAEPMGVARTLRSWTGPTGTPQDFGFSGRFVEVKTTAQKKPVSIEITSERQLDTTNATSLHLWVLVLDVRVGFGETLPEIVERTRAAARDAGQGVWFEGLLMEAGYLDIHAPNYTSGYQLRSSTIHEVVEDFPRITENGCPPGVGDVHYHLQLGAIENYSREEDHVFATLEADNG